ncbi:hypothetical protein MMPV_004544 [Pyropia vietnamensis]
MMQRRTHFDAMPAYVWDSPAPSGSAGVGGGGPPGSASGAPSTGATIGGGAGRHTVVTVGAADAPASSTGGRPPLQPSSTLVAGGGAGSLGSIGSAGGGGGGGGAVEMAAAVAMASAAGWAAAARPGRILAGFSLWPPGGWLGDLAAAGKQVFSWRSWVAPPAAAGSGGEGGGPVAAEMGLGSTPAEGGGDAAAAAAAVAAVPAVALEPASAGAPTLGQDGTRLAAAGETLPKTPLAAEPPTVSTEGTAAGALGTAEAAAPAAVNPASVPASTAVSETVPSSLSPPPAVEATAAAAPVSHCAAAAAAGAPCVLDLGFNTGQDTHFYLADGYTVIGVDANPDLIAAGRTRFADATTKGMLTLVSNGLVGEVADGVKPPETLRFYRSKLRSEWSSFDASWGCRNPNNTPVEKEVPAHCEVIEVPVTTCAGLIQRFGKPLYMKIDIEGRDTACLNSLHTLPRASRPTFVSVENVNEAHIDLLSALGYTSQKAVDQRVIHARYMGQPDLLGNSGPFGDAAVHLSGKTEWVSAQEVRGLLPLPERHEPTGEGMWYDLHGRLEGDPAAEGGSYVPSTPAAESTKAAPAPAPAAAV